jgi:hypothetical protein
MVDVRCPSLAAVGGAGTAPRLVIKLVGAQRLRFIFATAALVQSTLRRP